MSVALFTDRAMAAHEAGEGHPERPERLTTLIDALERAPVPGVMWRGATPASREQLARVHWASYLDLVDSAEGEYAEREEAAGRKQAIQRIVNEIIEGAQSQW